jgi:hypothetical protein
MMHGGCPLAYPLTVLLTQRGHVAVYSWSGYSNMNQFNGNSGNNDSKGDTVQADTQIAVAATSNTTYPLQIELPTENTNMMSGLMGSNSMGLYGGTLDDFDFGEITEGDFCFFDEVDRFTDG